MKRRNFLRTTGSLATLGALSSLHQAASAADGRPIRIGVQSELTGAMATSGYWSSRGIKGGVAWINNHGGIGGRKVELVIADTETSVDVGVRKLRQLIEDAKVDFIMGTEHGGIALASLPVVASAKIPYFTITRTDKVTEEPLNKYVYRTNVNTTLTTTAAAPYLLKQIGPTWDTVFSDYVWGHSHDQSWTAQVQKINGKVLSRASLRVGTPDPLPYIVGLNKSADGLYVALLQPDMLRTLQGLLQIGFQGPKMVMADDVFGLVDVKSFLSMGNAANGMWGLNSLPIELADKNTKPMQELYNSVGIDSMGRELKTGTGAMTGEMWQGWVTVGIIKKAVEGSGWRSGADTDAFLDWLTKNPHFEEGPLFPQGPIYLRPQDHQLFCDYYILRYENGTAKSVKKFDLNAGIFPPKVDLTQTS